MNYPELYQAISRARFNLSSEIDVQNGIESILKKGGLRIQFWGREYPLDKNSRIDFLVDNSLGVEVKIKGTKKSIYKQLLRYSESDFIHEIILVTSKTLGLPATLNNKPVYVINISKAWL